jgi:hypothetical protein
MVTFPVTLPISSSGRRGWEDPRRIAADDQSAAILQLRFYSAWSLRSAAFFVRAAAAAFDAFTAISRLRSGDSFSARALAPTFASSLMARLTRAILVAFVWYRFGLFVAFAVMPSMMHHAAR